VHFAWAMGNAWLLRWGPEASANLADLSGGMP